jgi:autotransporter-associated beta strand protein
MSMVAVAASATLPAAVVESTDPDTGYKVLTVAAGEFAEYATVLDASVPGLIKRGAGTAWLTGANSAFAGPIQIEEGVLGGTTVRISMRSMLKRPRPLILRLATF